MNKNKKIQLLEDFKKVESNGSTQPSDPIEETSNRTEDIQFTETEKSILIASMSEAYQSIIEVQKLQELSQQKHDIMVGLTKASDKVFRTIMILKKVNPDAYRLKFDPQTGTISLEGRV